MTGLFLIAALALSALALLFVLFPLVRQTRAEARQRSRREVNAEVHRDRVAELRQDLDNGTLTRDQFDAALADLDRELLESGAVEPDSPSERPRRTPRYLIIGAAAASAVAVPVLAVAIYAMVGAGDQAFDEQVTAQQQGGGPGGHDMERVEELLGQLRQRLQENPEDAMGWTLLGRSMAFLGRYEEAAVAFEEAVKHGADDDPDVLVQYADVLAERQGSLEGRPMELIDQALALEPEHPQGLWLAGTAAFNESDYDEAQRQWEKLLSVLPPESDDASIIRANLEEVARRSEGG